MQFLPSPAETEIILRLRRRIVAALETNPDPAGPDEGDPRRKLNYNNRMIPIATFIPCMYSLCS